MKKLFCLPAVLILVSAGSSFAQEWEISGLGGYAFQTKLKAKSAAGEADAGFNNSYAVGVAVGNDMHRRLGGEFRYLYRGGSAFLESGSEKPSFSARQHLIHYDLLLHFADRGQKVRPFVAFGAGIKVVEGRGVEHAFQPLGQYAVFTARNQVLPLVSVGAGVKFKMGKNGIFRVEVRDYLSTRPDEVIAPVPGGKLSGWMNDFIPAIGMGLNW